MKRSVSFKLTGVTLLLFACFFFATYRNAEALVEGTWLRLPTDGVVTGNSGGLGPLAVCRSLFDNGQHAGKLWEGQCNFGWGGKEYRSSDFEVLKDNGFRWQNPGSYQNTQLGTNFSIQIPSNAVDAGDAGNAARHVRLVVCQGYVSSDNTWHPGKFYKDFCNIAWGGKERKITPTANGDVLILVR